MTDEDFSALIDALQTGNPWGWSHVKNAADMLLALKARAEAVEKREAEAYEYASRLLMLLVAKFSDVHPEFRPLPDLYGVLTQIDNATTGLEAKP